MSFSSFFFIFVFVSLLNYVVVVLFYFFIILIHFFLESFFRIGGENSSENYRHVHFGISKKDQIK